MLVNPKIEVSTKEIFQSLNVKKLSTNIKDKKNIKYCNSIDFLKSRQNDLQKYAIKKNNVIGEILTFLSLCKGSLLSRMTGSGATCYALFENMNDLENAKIHAKENFENCWIKSSKLINSVGHI